MAPTPSRSNTNRKHQSDSSQGIQSVARALSILELFDERRPALTTSEIAELAKLNRATAYRFCQTLLRLGYLEESGQGGLRPGLKAVSLARAALSSRELPELALPYMKDLQAETGETVNMGLLDGDEIVYISRLLSDHLLSIRLFVGSRLPAWSTSLGRAILAFMASEEVDEMLEASELEPLTERTIIDRDHLRAELKQIRGRGYAVNDQELVNGLIGVAAPVFSASGDPIAAINISIPHPVERGRIESELASAVMRTARSISALATRIGADRV